MVQTNLNYFSTANCLVTFQEQSTICYKTLKVIVYITSKCLFVSNKAIFAYIFGQILMKKVLSKAISSIWFWLNDLLTRGQQNQLHLLFDHSLHVRAASSIDHWWLLPDHA